MPTHIRVSFQRQCADLLSMLQWAQQENKKIVYLDEINFTKRSVSSREWSQKNSNLTIDQRDIYVGYRSVIASMTEENGIGSWEIY